MYTVQIEHECGCFKRSEYNGYKEFENQQDAYNYSKILSELMNDDFCGKHHFFAQRISDNNFMVRVVDNPNASSCGTGGGGSCGTSCGCD